jgi:hypothetical protein
MFRNRDENFNISPAKTIPWIILAGGLFFAISPFFADIKEKPLSLTPVYLFLVLSM